VGSMITWDLDKKTCESLQKSIISFVLDFMPLDQITNMSLNGLSMRVETHNKKLIMP
jgi:hypothetical protein